VTLWGTLENTPFSSLPVSGPLVPNRLETCGGLATRPGRPQIIPEPAERSGGLLFVRSRAGVQATDDDEFASRDVDTGPPTMGGPVTIPRLTSFSASKISIESLPSPPHGSGALIGDVKPLPRWIHGEVFRASRSETVLSLRSCVEKRLRPAWPIARKSFFPFQPPGTANTSRHPGQSVSLSKTSLRFWVERLSGGAG